MNSDTNQGPGFSGKRGFQNLKLVYMNSKTCKEFENYLLAFDPCLNERVRDLSVRLLRYLQKMREGGERESTGEREVSVCVCGPKIWVTNNP